MASTVWMKKAELTETAIQKAALPLLRDGEVRLKIESFSITANNVTYAIIGDLFGYWSFFPADGEWGVVPVWGHAIVEQSRRPDFAVGERIYGYLPMGTHLDVLPGKISAGAFTDMAAHRQPMSPIYNQYSRLAFDPEHDQAKEAERMLFGPLFKTGFLIQSMFHREGWFGAQSLIMTSASSKTSMGLASVAKDQSPAVERIGLTSAGNVEFVRATGLYDKVLCYEALASLPKQSSVCVDFAGNGSLLRGIHSELRENLKYSCLVGATHVGARGLGDGKWVGPKPILFFAPDHAVATVQELGPKGFGKAVGASWKSFLAAVEGAVKLDERQGLDAAIDAFAKTLHGKVDPQNGIIIRP